MRSFYNDNKGNYREGNILIFLECSIDNYLQILENKVEIEKINNKQIFFDENGKLSLDFDSDSFLLLTKKNHKLIIQSIITLCAFLESLINEIGSIELGSPYFKDNLDSLSILAKWEVTLKLVYGESLNKSENYYRNYKDLITARNKLVHYKSKIVGKNQDITPLDYYEKILFESIKSLPKLIEDFEKLNKTKGTISIIEIKSQFSRLK